MELPKRFTNGISNDFGNLSRKVEDEVMVGGECLFYQQRDGPLMPTLRLVHKYPLPKKERQESVEDWEKEK